MCKLTVTAALVRSILEHYDSFEWTVQGFGFLRTKVAHVGRIHIWDSRLAAPFVSTMHTHPWDFKSTIISGELINLKFRAAVDYEIESELSLPYRVQSIQTGEGGGLIGESAEIELTCYPHSGFYTSGMSYTQRADEIHRTKAEDGTVTLLERQQGPPNETAFVYWPRGANWGSAEPRPARLGEVDTVVRRALDLWVPK